MRIMLSNPPWTVGGKKGVRAGSRWPHLKIAEEGNYMPFPFFLAYAAAVLEQNGIEVLLCDAIAEDISEGSFFERVQSFAPDLLVVETSTPTLSHDCGLLKKMREFYPGTLVLAGPEGSMYRLEFLEAHPEVDAVLVGEYDYTLRDLVIAMDAGAPLASVDGIIYRENGSVRATPRRAPIADVNDLPWPKREGLPMERYDDRPGGIPYPSVQMWASRGCPFGCSFCIWPQLMYGGRNYRPRNMTDVVDEMQYLASCGYKSVYFDDDTFNIGNHRLLFFARELIKRDLNMPFAIMARADTMTPGVLGELYQAGLRAVKYGVESGVQKLVDGIDKCLNLETVASMVEETKRLGIFTHLSFTFGLPGETWETIQQSIDFALRLDPDSVQFSIATPFPGTAFHREMSRKKFLVACDSSRFDGNYSSPIKTRDLTPQDLIDARIKAYDRWQSHKKRQFISDHLDLAGILDGERAFKGPFHAQIDLTNACNNNCIACWCNSPLLGEKSNKDGASLPLETVEGLIEDLEQMNTREIYLAGGGEPFMHKDLLDVVALIKNHGMVCHINTNFTLVKPDTIDRLIEMGVDHLIVSLWAATAGTYAATHPNQTEATFEQMRETLQYLLRKKSGRPYVKLYNVMFTHNFHEFEDMVHFARELGVDAAEFTVVDTIPGKTDSLLLTEEMKWEILSHIAHFKEAIPYDYEWKEGNYIFKFPDGKSIKLFKFEHFIRRLLNQEGLTADYDMDVVRKIPCYIGWLFTRILGNGDVNACLKAHRIPVGNIHSQRFRDIWNSPKQRYFRRKALDIRKSDPLFASIGNDPDCAIGCFKGCDDIIRNIVWHHKIESLTEQQRCLLKSVGRHKERGLNEAN